MEGEGFKDAYMKDLTGLVRSVCWAGRIAQNLDVIGLDFLAHGGLVVKPYRQGRGFDPMVRSSRVLPVPRLTPSVQRHAR